MVFAKYGPQNKELGSRCDLLGLGACAVYHRPGVFFLQRSANGHLWKEVEMGGHVTKGTVAKWNKHRTEVGEEEQWVRA